MFVRAKERKKISVLTFLSFREETLLPSGVCETERERLCVCVCVCLGKRENRRAPYLPYCLNSFWPSVCVLETDRKKLCVCI